MRKAVLPVLLFLSLAALPLSAQDGRKKKAIDLEQEFFQLPDSVTNEYLDNTLSGEPRNPWISNLQPHHIVRPIPQQFLDQIANPDEFGTNGY